MEKNNLKGYYIVPDMKSREIGVNKKFQYHINEFNKISSIELIRVPENKNITRFMMRLPIGSSGCNYKYVEDRMYIFEKRIWMQN